MKTLDCPLPQTGFDRINLGHGSGGELTNDLLDAHVFSIFKNPYLDSRHDGSILNIPGKIAFSTDSFVVDPVFFPGGNIGDLAVNGTVNDLAMCGAVPKYISLALILEEGFAIDELKLILNSVKIAAQKAGIDVVTGDTKVVEKGKGDKIYINTTGIGELLPTASIHIDNIAPGDQILVSGNIATHGMALMSVREGLEFETSLESDSAALHEMTIKLIEAYGAKIHLLRDPTRGGLATVLNEIVKSTSLGINLKEKNIPMHKEVDAACELLGLDPLHVANEGVFVAFVDGDIAEDCCALLNNYELGRQAVLVGEVVEKHPGRVVLSNVSGGNRVVRMLSGMQLPRIC